MSVSGPGRVIDNGLVLYLDASNNKSIVSGSTTWFDVSRSGNNGTLTNGPAYSSANGGSIVFDGVDDHVTSVLSSTLGNQFTISSWFKKNNNSTLVITSFQGSPTFELLVDQTNRLNIWDGADHFYNFTTTIGAWYNMVVVKTTTNSLLYVNANPNPVLNFASSYSNANANFIIAKHPSVSTGYLNGNLGQVQIYNRAMSASEILANYNLEKKRFGL